MKISSQFEFTFMSAPLSAAPAKRHRPRPARRCAKGQKPVQLDLPLVFAPVVKKTPWRERLAVLWQWLVALASFAGATQFVAVPHAG